VRGLAKGVCVGLAQGRSILHVNYYFLSVQVGMYTVGTVPIPICTNMVPTKRFVCLHKNEKKNT